MVDRILSPSSLKKIRWFFLAAWLVAVMAMGAGGIPDKFDDAQENESTSFLPGDAESTAALELSEEIQGDELAPIVIVYQREGGLTAADREAIAADREELNTDRAEQVSPYVEPVVSPGGDAAILRAEVAADGESDTLLDPVDRAREVVNDDGGLEVAVTGGAGFAADAISVFESIDGTLLVATATIVFLLLLAVYRSPIFWILPLLAVGFAEISARSAGYGLSELGVTINGQSAGILPVLVFGAGTDYALLLVARYREELRRHENKHEAMSIALRRAGPAILASGGTVVAALLCLSIADVEGTAGLGPIGAMGIAVAMLAMLTALPALLLATGRWVFWPLVPHVGDDAADETHGIWRRIGEVIDRRPRKIWIGSLVLLGVMSLGWTQLDTGLTQGNQFRDDVESVQGQEILERSFPGGASAPTEVVVPDQGDVQPVLSALRTAPGVADAMPIAEAPEGALIAATLEIDPYSTDAFDLVEPIRGAVTDAGGEEVLVGGATAVEFDLRQAAERDTLVIPPIALAVVLLILVVLLRALVAPLLLIGTVIVSFVAALGVGYVVFDVIFGFPGSDPSLPLFAFIFLVALGVDYNIFLMARAREETLEHGNEQGMLRALAVTGGVITSAGLVLAGTFSTLAVLPLIFLTELGFVVAFGVLLDTFIVRSILVPAAVLDIGRKTWWPSALSRRA
ncbi:MAG: MMPL family transporter [Solirubrobacterales bacterium]